MFPSHAVLVAQLSSVAHRALATSTGGSTGSSKSNPGPTLIIIVALFALVYFFLIRPQRRRTQAAVATQNEIEPGQKVLTRHGQIAYVVEVDGDEIVLEIAPGVHSRFVKEAIARVIPPPEPDEGITDPDADPSYNELPDDPDATTAVDHGDHDHPEADIQPHPETDISGTDTDSSDTDS